MKIFIGEKMTDHLDKMLVGIAIGDAYGACYEMLTQKQVARLFKSKGWNYFDRPIGGQYGGWEGISAGQYTDDTQMSIAVVETILRLPKYLPNALAFAFVECYKRDRRNGYARRFQEFLDSIDSGAELLEKIKPHSERNGACMRAVPIGLYSEYIPVVKTVAANNALVTHNTPKGIASSVCVAAASYYILQQKGCMDDLSVFCADLVQDICTESAEHFDSAPWVSSTDELCHPKDPNKGIPCDGMRTAGAVLHILHHYSTDPLEALKQSILLGGDTDSVASPVVGILSAKYGLDWIPTELKQGLEDGPYGYSFLLKKGKEFAERSL